MTNQINPQPEVAHLAEHPDDFKQWEGEYNEHVLRELEAGGSVYQTNLPENVHIFEPGDDSELQHLKLHPESLDALPEGIFTIGRTEEVESWDTGETKPQEVKREIKVWTSSKGKVVSKESFPNERWVQPDNGTEGLLKELGYEIEEADGYQRIVGIPTPETLKSAAGLLGVKVELIAHVGHLKAPDYLKVFAEGAYPVSIATESDYRHDSEDDHITALVLGGDPLKEALQKTAIEALTKDEDTAKTITSGIDTFTASLRAVIAPHHEISGEAYGVEQGRGTIIELGKGLGIDPEATNEIIRTAQENGKKLGIQVKELH